MLHAPYPHDPDQWPRTPIAREINPLTGYPEGEDKGYRQVRTDSRNVEELVEPDVDMRPSYDGFDEYGNPHNPNIALAGGIEGKRLVVRETVARALEHAQSVLDRRFGGAYRISALDGFRSEVRQSAGFTRILQSVLDEKRITNPTDIELYDAGMTADGTFAWVNVDERSNAFTTAVAGLRTDNEFMDAMREIASRSLDHGAVLTDALIDEAIGNYVVISANSRMGRLEPGSMPMISENNAHAGGGAVDMFLTDTAGRPINIVPFDYVGPEAAVDFTEHPEHYDAFIKRATADPRLADHLKQLGYTTVQQFTVTDWQLFVEVNRIRYHLMRSLGATYYSAADSKDGGENWHWEPGNIVYGPDGSLVHIAQSAIHNVNSGNPGHTLQVNGPQATAVWGGSTAHDIARKKFGLAV